MYFIEKSANGAALIPLESLHFKNRILYLTEDISDDSILDLQKQLFTLAEKDDPALLVIDSNGGSIQAGLSLIGSMRSAGFPIDTLVLNTAASMAAVIFICGTGKRYMGEYAKLFLHEPLVTGLKDGSLSGVKETLGNLQDSRDKICRILADRTGKSIREMKKAISSDRYYDYEDAVKYGFVDEIGQLSLCLRYGKERTYHG